MLFMQKMVLRHKAANDLNAVVLVAFSLPLSK
jgi:hypothetical protein